MSLFDMIFMALPVITLVIGALIGTVGLLLFERSRVPGVWIWLVSSIQNLPVAINAYMDGWSEYKAMKKEPGSLVFNSGGPDEFIDRSMVDNRPMQMLHGHRVMVRVSASAIPNTFDELGEIQRVIDHIDENVALYPRLSKLPEFEWFASIGEEPQIVREIMTKHCMVEKEYVENNKKVTRSDEEVNLLVATQVDAYMAEIELLKRNLKWVPRRSVFVDLARCVNATQLRIASQILKRYRAEIEAFYRAKYGNQASEFWKGAVMGGAVAAVGAGLAVKLLVG